MTRTAFQYRALTSDGTEVTGEVEAASQEEAASKIQARGLFPFEAMERSLGSESRRSPTATKPSSIHPAPRQGPRKRVSGRHRLEALRLLTPLLAARIPTDRALTVAGETARSPATTQAFLAMAHQVAGGASLSQAMDHDLAPFLPEDQAVAQAGETAAKLGEVMSQLTARVEAEQQLSSRIRAALVYPAIVLFVAAVAFIIMAQGVLPRFTAMFPALGKPVPPGLEFASFLATAVSALILGGLLLFALLAGLARISPLAQDLFGSLKDGLSRLLPGMTALKRDAAAERGIGLLALLVGARVPLPEALALAGQAAGSKPLELALLRARQAVLSGGGLASSFAAEPALPRAVAEFTRIGEEAGDLGQSLDQAARMLARQSSERAERLQSVITPLLTIAMGVLIGGLLYVMISAIMEVYGSLLT